MFMLVAAHMRKAFVMQLRAGNTAEYRRRHAPIWPELEATLKEHGVVSYSIFLHPATLQLFAYAECDSEARWNAIAETQVCRRWWASMKELMETNADDSPTAVQLSEVFHLSQPT